MLATARTKLGTTRTMIAFAIVYFVSQAIIGAILHPLGSLDFVRAQTTFSRETFLALTARWEAQGLLGRYWLHFVLDFVHPAFYACLLAGLLARQLDRLAIVGNGVLAVPFVAGAMDLVENVCHVVLLSTRPNVSGAIVTVGATASNTKWLLAGGSLVAVGLLSLRKPS